MEQEEGAFWSPDPMILDRDHPRHVSSTVADLVLRHWQPGCAVVEASQRGLLRWALPARPGTVWHMVQGGTPEELLPSPICGPMLPVLSFQL